MQLRKHVFLTPAWDCPCPLQSFRNSYGLEAWSMKLLNPVSLHKMLSILHDQLTGRYSQERAGSGSTARAEQGLESQGLCREWGFALKAEGSFLADLFKLEWPQEPCGHRLVSVSLKNRFDFQAHTHTQTHLYLVVFSYDLINHSTCKNMEGEVQMTQNLTWQYCMQLH